MSMPVLASAAAALGALFLVASVYFVFSIFKYTRMIGNIFLSLVYKEEPDASADPRGEKITILDSGDHEIPALFLEKKGAHGIAVFCHESGSGKESWEKYASFLPELGYHVLSVDYLKVDESAHNSLSQWPLEEEAHRLSIVVRWAKRVSGRVVLFGVSKGADVALAVSARDASVCAVVTDGLFSMKEVFRDYIRRWAPVLVKPNFFGENYPGWIVNLFADLGYRRCEAEAKKTFIDVEKLLKNPHPPLLMIHGEEDDYVSARHQRFLGKIARRGTAEPWIVPKAGHNQAVILARPEYEKKIADFLRSIA